MPYAEPEDLELGIPAAALDGITEPEKEAAIEAASDLMDGYLETAFTLPITAHGEDVTRACVSIAIYDLLTKRGFDVDAGTDEHIRLRFQDAVRWLEMIAANKVRPAGVVDSTPEVNEALPAVTSRCRRGWSAF